MIDQLNRRFSKLKTDRASWQSHWQDLADFLLPRNIQLFTNQTLNRGEKKHQKIYDNTGTVALRNLAAGMMSGRTSRSTEWFGITISDSDKMKFKPVKVWLNDVVERMRDVLSASNVYRTLAGTYKELGVFGIAPSFVSEDFEKVIHLHPMILGEYYVAVNWKGEVDTLYREFQRSVIATVAEFGLENCSQFVKNAYSTGNYDTLVTIRHCVEPRLDYNPTSKLATEMPFKSCYWEASETDNKYLRESGYKSKPFLCPRWDVVPGDAYGISPAMDALGDIMGLQASEFRALQAIDFKANPPLQVPSSMQNREVEMFPGGRTYYDPTAAQAGIRNMFEVQLDIRELMVKQQESRQRIHNAFYSDIFMMLTQMDGTKTAYEIAQRKEEKMMVLGSVIERLDNELDEPLIEMLFEKMLMGNLLPPPPQELQGETLNIEHTSTLSQAHKIVSVNSMDRYVSALGQIASIKPDVLDKFDSDYWADIYADKLGVDPELIVEGQQVALIRQQRSQAAEMQKKQDAYLAASQATKNVGGVSTQPGTVVGDALAQMKGNR